ncbi:hypothetical protein RND71_005769 [Anisodus tanguticus]|uniref:Uncharacterized protein n=1 Tax=Anisodus tanguticus TaxID=243964 RepID=A0AAE1STS6_9SOLA|nr:hypothetical protein RND71_005769 [Anisodus tanguticus]
MASLSSKVVSSLEKRVMPRNEVLIFLKENQLVIGKLSLYTVVLPSEPEFQKKYVLPFRKKMPQVYDLYMKTRS